MTTNIIQRYAVSGDIAYPIHEDPEGDYVTYEDHVAAIEADRKRRGEPVAEAIERLAINRYRPVPAGVLAYKVVAGDGSRSLFSGTKDECKIVATKLTEAFLDGAHVAAQPAEPVKVRFKQNQPCPHCGAGPFYCCGHPFREDEPVKEQAAACKVDLQSGLCETVKGLSDADIEDIAKQFDRPKESRGNAYCFDWLGFARALLARYGQPAQPAEDRSLGIATLKDVDAMIGMLRAGEWAGNVAKTPMSRNLEAAITKLHAQPAASAEPIKTVRLRDEGSEIYLDGVECRYSVEVGDKWPSSETLAYVFDKTIAERIVEALSAPVAAQPSVAAILLEEVNLLRTDPDSELSDGARRSLARVEAVLRATPPPSQQGGT